MDVKNKVWAQIKKEMGYPQLEKNLRNDGYKFLKISKYKSDPVKIFKSVEKKKNFEDAYFNDMLIKIYLGIGCEYLLKSLFLKKGYDIFEYKLKKLPKLNKIEKSITKEKRTIGFGLMHDNIKKVLPAIKGDDLKKVKEGLGIIKNWRNGDIHISSGFRRNRIEEHRLVVFTIKTITKFVGNPE